ncbi:hypothetical protein HRbin17_02301 [bacterium HR17]|uniref:Uncharacterized protein n=1 Tax=Candidatus Fervidibacter japonicus TaxID=2035412 RepID=A0A2H5XF17_9BACT|nr:hypothetical protein HRbin17_02301 [bacterium HR17]
MRRLLLGGSESRPPNEPSAFSEGASLMRHLLLGGSESRPPNEPSAFSEGASPDAPLASRRLKRAALRTSPLHLGGRIS